MKYFFVPGHEWDLSLAELKTLLNSFGVSYVEIKVTPQLFIFDINFDIDFAIEFFEQLGGFVRFGFVVDEPYQYLENNVVDQALENDERVNFSVSLLGDSQKVKSMKSQKNKLGMDLKRWLKSKSIKCRFVSDFKKPKSSTVLLEKNDVLDDGFELDLLLFSDKKDREWGFTLAVQDFENFSKRDYDRPRSNKQKGMIPPKLGRIMINLARPSQSQPNADTFQKGQKPNLKKLNSNLTLWDPFCGSGTILQEGMVLGYNVTGSDVDKTAISETKENTSWISETYMISHKKYEIFQHDITEKIDKSLEFNIIATEPYLGPVQLETTLVNEVEKILNKLRPLYKAIQQRINEQDCHGRMAIVVPGFRTHQDWLDMDFPFIDDSPLTDVSKDISQKPLQWDRQNSIIRRNIKVFRF
jgi:tRNA G10  N-methylase Trm11